MNFHLKASLTRGLFFTIGTYIGFAQTNGIQNGTHYRSGRPYKRDDSKHLLDKWTAGAFFVMTVHLIRLLEMTIRRMHAI
jgi:hypothetical protein